jgi:hypothetical protein
VAEHAPGNGRDKDAQRRRLVRQLAGLDASSRLEALTDAEDARALVHAHPAERLYFDILEVGLADATDVIQLAAPEQFQSFVDLGAWKGDSFQPRALLRWLRAARGEDVDCFRAQLDGLDLELLELLLRETTTIHDLEEETDLHVEGLTLDSADGRYRVEFLGEDGADQSTLRTLLLDLMDRDALGLSRLLEAVRWELPSELEEVAHRFRTARLADLGFPTPETARALHARVPLPVDAVDLEASALARETHRTDLLAEALAGLTADERANLEDELRTVVNAVLVSDGADPGDPMAFRSSSERARDTLQLGLETLSGGDPVRAVEVVRSETSKRLFQVGFTLGLELKLRADKLARRPMARLDGEWLLWPDAEATVNALRRPRPLRALRVEGAEPVPFRRMREVHESRALLARAEHQATLLAALLGGTPERARVALHSLEPDWPAGGMPAVLLAALAHGALDGVLRVEPVAQSALAPLAGALLEGSPDAPRIRPEMRQQLVTLVAKLAPQTGDEPERLVDAALERLVTEVGPALATGQLPREASTLLPFR